MPAELPVTSTVMVQELFARMLPLERLMTLPPAVAVKVPPQVFDVASGDAITTPDGSVSLNATPVRVLLVFTLLVLGLVRVNVNIELAPTAMGSGEKFFVIVGGFGGTGQPVKTMLSRYTKISSPGRVFCGLRESKRSRNAVVLVPLLVFVAFSADCQLPLLMVIVDNKLYAPPFSLV